MDANKGNKILILGSGGREHALAWRAKHEGYDVHVAPGSDAIASLGSCHAVDLDDAGAVCALAGRIQPNAVIVGPEQPLVDGLADTLESAGWPTFGPSKQAAQLEGSKAFAKAFMERHGIPTAKATRVTSLQQGLDALQGMTQPPVVKASGLAAGKGVVVCETQGEAEAALRDCFEGKFGAAGQEVLLEERLHGQEASVFVLCSGEDGQMLAPCQDHKRLGEGDVGPNTGGMGAYLPAPIVDGAVLARIQNEIVTPTLRGLVQENMPYRGVLFLGLMIDPNGQPLVIEYNVRWGDPETQVLMLGARGDLMGAMAAIAQKRWTPSSISFQPCAHVVMASAGYPASSTKGSPITGLEPEDAPSTWVFHAGTRRQDQGWVSHGGRVLGVSACADSLEDAITQAYARMDQISMPGAQLRRDIGHRAINPTKP